MRVAAVEGRELGTRWCGTLETKSQALDFLLSWGATGGFVPWGHMPGFSLRASSPLVWEGNLSPGTEPTGG